MSEEHLANGQWRVFASCAACRDMVIGILMVVSATQHSPKTVSANIEGRGYAVTGMWPERRSALAPPFTPKSVESRFLDGEFNFASGRWNAAVGLYRATLDLATKALDAKGDTFFERLKWLAEQHRVTPDIKDWADHVRVDGNEALHDPDEFSKEDAEPLRHFTEMFLRYVFEMPGRVAEFRKVDNG